MSLKVKGAKRVEAEVEAQAEGRTGFNDRNSRSWEPWEEAILMSPPDHVHDDLTRFQMECPHISIKDPRTAISEDASYRRCGECQAILRWWTTYPETLRGEWLRHRIVGYSPTAWGELFDPDKSLWAFIIEEARDALSDKENANA